MHCPKQALCTLGPAKIFPKVSKIFVEQLKLNIRVTAFIVLFLPWPLPILVLGLVRSKRVTVALFHALCAAISSQLPLPS
jgi:hypothetical protein